MNPKNLAIYSIILIATTAGVTRWAWPVVQKETKIEEKEVVKTRIVTQVREVVKPDGTTVRDTVITDNSEETRRRVERQVERVLHNWVVGVGATTGYDKLEPTYTLDVSRRILGPFFVGGRVGEQEAGVTVSMEF